MSWFSGFFKEKKVGKLQTSFEIYAGMRQIKQVLSFENQRKAHEIAKKLMLRKDMDSCQKAQLFNTQMLDWAKAFNRKISDSALNCLRELAVVAAKAEEEYKEMKETEK